jgi:citrate lyase subunit beta/citryl-CoA lyase
LEAREGLNRGRIEILPIVTETARAMFGLGSYANATSRLRAMMWGCEDLAADVGAAANRAPDNSYLAPFDLARSLCLFAAASAGVAAIDTVFTDIHDAAGLERETRAAAQVGFSAKAAIHPGQVEVINRAFTPDTDAIAWARKIVAAFATTPDIGVVSVEGKMLDKPHLRAAERILARAGLAA